MVLLDVICIQIFGTPLYRAIENELMKRKAPPKSSPLLCIDIKGVRTIKGSVNENGTCNVILLVSNDDWQERIIQLAADANGPY